jgi:large subunit ribosomal protein L5e
MAYVAIVKNRAYFKRYQVKPRRRREGKTDYQARKKLCSQDRNKYATPRYRLIVRKTNKDIVAQFAKSNLDGDQVLAAAYAHELPAYGCKIGGGGCGKSRKKRGGLTSYAAAYATGLLAARRLLKRLNMDSKYAGVKKADGKDFNVVAPEEPSRENPRPLTAVLDIGLARTSTGANIFGVLKGATDGGVAIPHSETRFPGAPKGKGSFDDKKHRDRIFGKHVAEYQKLLLDESDPEQYSPETYDRQFSQYKAAGIKPDDIEKMWQAVHDEIRKDPEKSAPKQKRAARKKAGALSKDQKDALRKATKRPRHATTEVRLAARLEKKRKIAASIAEDDD